MTQTTALAAVAIAAAAATTAQAATVAYFEFNEGEGQTAASTGGVADPLTLGFSTSASGDPDWVSGVSGTGLDFNGLNANPNDNDFVGYAPNRTTGTPDSALVQSGSFTIEAFFRLDSVPAVNEIRSIVSLYESDPNGPATGTGLGNAHYQLRVRNSAGNTVLESAFQTDAGTAFSRAVFGNPFPSAALAVGEVYYGAMIYDADAATLTTRLDSISETTNGVGAPDTSINLPRFVIGARTNGFSGYGQHFDGLIDQVRISDAVVAEGDLLINVIPEPTSAAAAMLGLGLLAARRLR